MTYKNVIFKYVMYKSNGDPKITHKDRAINLTDEDVNEFCEEEQFDADTNYDPTTDTLTVTFDCGDWD